jgi:hypothetical protein
MKQSSSTTSLTALTEANFERECFICIDIANESGEPLVDSSILRTCGCKFVVHPECWNKWMVGKSDWDCPICHKKSLNTPSVAPNPVLSMDVEDRFIPFGCSFYIYISIASLFFIGMIIGITLSFMK